MKEIQEVLRHYREADNTLRLHLYLQHRDLRSEFMAIERGSFPKKSRSGAREKIFEKTGCRRLRVSCLKALRTSHGGA